ncbi:MAG: copper homeostasis protein CutC [Prevotella sp.]|jgi:copper homeostasis protein|nr:copper homeostasis protein CutC [Prevotella sp.]
MITLEVCAGSISSAIEAEKGGAIRVELCDNLAQGGTTPSKGEIDKTRQLIDIKLNVLIRPREGDFLYNDIEFEIMKEDIRQCGLSGCDGVVFGILTAEGKVDIERNNELVNIARQYNMSATFHRAFDRCANLPESMEDIIKLGCDRILTSGGKVSATEGKNIIRELIEKAKERIIIMPGGGITENNISELVKATNLTEFHGSFRSRVKGDMEYISPIFNDENEEYSILQTDAKKVKKAIENANE